VNDVAIRRATLEDAPAVARIYNPYIRSTAITFEEVEVSAEEIASRMRAVADALRPWLVLEEAGSVIGYAYASRWHARSAYRHTAETTIYLDASACGRGHGRRLYGTLLDQLRGLPVHVVVGVIALPNDASVALHEKLGFEKVAHYRAVGRKFDRWLDVGAWQLLL